MDDNDQFKMDRKDEFKRRGDKCEMGLWSEKQSTLPPKIYKIKGLTTGITFEYPGVYGSKCLYLYRVKIIKVINETKFSVKIEWNESTLAESDMQFSLNKLVPGNWKPKKIIKGGWSNYIA